jgi:hypothetical protein
MRCENKCLQRRWSLASSDWLQTMHRAHVAPCASLGALLFISNGSINYDVNNIYRCCVFTIHASLKLIPHHYFLQNIFILDVLMQFMIFVVVSCSLVATKLPVRLRTLMMHTSIYNWQTMLKFQHPHVMCTYSPYNCCDCLKINNINKCKFIR